MEQLQRTNETAHVLVVTPWKREASLIRAALERAGIASDSCCSIDQYLRESGSAADLIVLAEEALDTDQRVEALLEHAATNESGPPTLLILARRRAAHHSSNAGSVVRDRLVSSNSATILKRPLRRKTFISDVQSLQGLRATQLAQRRLSDQRQMLRVITESLPALISYIDRDCRYQFNNAGYRTWYGVEPESLMGQTIDVVLDTEVTAAARPHIEAALRGEPQDFDMELSVPLLGRRHVRTQYIPHVDSEGNVRGIFAMLTDLTQRRDAERALAESQQRFVAFMDNLPGAAWIKDLLGSYVYANTEASRVFNRPIEDLIGKTDDEIFGAETARQFRENDSRVISDGQPVHTIETLPQADGHIHHSIVSKFAVPGPDGAIAGIGGVAIDISDRRAAEQALRESEVRYRSLIEALPAAVYTCDAQGRILLYNQAAIQLWGREPKLGEDLWCGSWRIHTPDGAPVPLEDCPMAATIRQGRAVRGVELVIERPDGTRRHILPYPEPVFDASGSILGAVNMLVDITDRKLHEQALQALVDCTRVKGPDFFACLVKALAEALRMECVLLGELLPGSPQRVKCDAMWLDGRSSSGLEYDLAGSPCEHVLTQGVCMYPSRVAELFPSDAMLAQFGAESYVGVPLRAADGRAIGILAAIGKRPLANASQTASLLEVFAGHAAAELERQRAEHALRCSEEQFRRAIDDAPVPVIVHSDDGQIIRVSKTWSRLTGLNPGDVASFDEWLERCQVQPAHVRERIGELFEGRVDSINIEMDVATSDSQQRVWALSASSPGTLDDGRRFVVSMAVDITERKQSETELTRYHELLEQLVQERTAQLERSHEQLRVSERMAALGTLSAGLGHDMGNLLLPVRLRLDAMEGKGLPEHLHEDVRAIRQCAEYLQKLANGLRLFALDPDETDGHENRTELHEWWSEVQSFLRNVLPRAVELERRFADPMPAVAMPRHRLTQAVFNLVQNAGSALRGRSSGKVVVWAEPCVGRGMIRIAVTDDGPGMAPEVRARCLEPFFTTHTRSISTGLGLSLVHGIVAKAGGNMTIHSELGRGTTIMLELPAFDPPQEVSVPIRRAVVSRVDPRMRSYLASLLRPLGYDVSFDDRMRADTNLWITEGDEAIYSDAEAFATAQPGRRAIIFGYKPDSRPVSQVVCFSSVQKPTVVREALRLVSNEIVLELKDSHANGGRADQNTLCR